MWNSFVYGSEPIKGYIEKEGEIQSVTVIVDEYQFVDFNVIGFKVISTIKIFKLQSKINPFKLFAKLHLQENLCDIYHNQKSIYKVYYNQEKNILVQI